MTRKFNNMKLCITKSQFGRSLTPGVAATLVGTFLLGLESKANGAPVEKPSNHDPKPTVLAIQESSFTLNGQPTFLLGISEYAILGAPEEFIRQDLDDLQRLGFNWLRLWVTWKSFDRDVSAVDAQGKPREPYLSKLQWVVAECDRRGLVVDVTLTRGNVSPDAISDGRIPNLPAHRRAVETLIDAIKDHRNWYLDLANERDVRDDRHVPVAELEQLRELVRRLDPDRLVTASFGGHDLSKSDLRDSLLTVGLDFVSPHRPRNPGSPAETERQTLKILGMMKELGRVAPVHYQEPFRRGYTSWQPSAADFLTDLRGALAGGAAGWCLHNGDERGTTENRPRRSFDLHAQRLFDQLDEQERIAVDRAAQEVSRFLGLKARGNPPSPEGPSDRP